MKKILSIILSAAMLATASSGVFAAQSEPQGDYNSLKLNVVNEVQNEVTQTIEAEEIQMFSVEAPAVLSSEDAAAENSDNNASSGSSSGGGGDSSTGGGGGSAARPEKVYDARFNDYYKAIDYEQWIDIRWDSATAQKIGELDNAERADFAFYNQSGELVDAINDVEVDNFYNYYSGSSYGNGYFYCYMNFVGFEPGTYDAEIILYDEAGVSFDLGKAELSITDKTILSNVGIWGELAETTQNFYVTAMLEGIFVDLDKLDMVLLNSNNEVVAETDSKDISYIYSNSKETTELRYGLEVLQTQPLVSGETYTLELRTATDLELVNYSGTVNVYVSGYPMISSASMDKNFKVTIYTENIIPGEYVVQYYDYNDNENDIYNITIDTQGKGSFEFMPPTEPEYSYGFELLTKEDNSFVCSFKVQNDYYYDDEYFYDGYTVPSFLSASVRTIEGFEARIQSEMRELTTESIKSVEITQDDEVVATLNDWEITNSWTNYYGDVNTNYAREVSMGWLKGNLTVLDGKSLTADTEVVMVVTYTDGSACRMWIPVIDENSGIYGGDVELDNSLYDWGYIDNQYYNCVTGDLKPSFTIWETNVSSGRVVLDNVTDGIEEESIDLSALSKTTKYGYVHTYKGKFNTELEEDKVYSVYLEANDESISSSNFIYYSGKLATNYSNLTVFDGEGYAYLEEFLNVSDMNNISFKAVSGKDKQAYSLPVTDKDIEENYADYYLDFSSVPTGYFTLKAYEGSTEIKLRNITNGYNYGNTDKVVTTGTGLKNVNGEKQLCLWGVNLDKVEKAEIKLYKYVTEEVKGNYFEKLVHIKDAELAKPYNKGYIIMPNTLLDGLETGEYTVIFILDGKAVETDEIYIVGEPSPYSAKVELNDGSSYTNSSDVEMKVINNGYAKMRYAFSKDALAEAEYQAIATGESKHTISLDGIEGEVTVYVQFADTSEAYTEITEAEITVDTVTPVLSAEETDKTVAVFDSTEFVIYSSEALRNALLVVKGEGEETDRTYVFSYVSAADGTYTYKCNLYADSRYIGSAAKDIEIYAIDRAGNKSEVLTGVLSIISPVDIYGQVKDGDNAVADTAVYLYENDEVIAVDYTDENGEYIFANIFAGNYEIKVSKRGFEPAAVTLSESEFENGDISGKDIALISKYSQTSDITVTVTDFDGNPVEGAKVRAYSYEAGSAYAETDVNGVAAMTVHSASGIYYSVHMSYGEYSDYRWIEVDGNENVNFRIPQVGTILGIAQIGETPIANAALTISGGGYSTYATTDENGAFEVKVFLDGNRAFTVTANDNSQYSGSESVEFAAGETTANVTLTLKGNIEIKGAIKDAQMQKVTAFSSIYISGNGKYLTVPVDNNGEFDTPPMFGAGTYYVSAYGWPYNSIYKEFTITEEDLENGLYDLQLEAEKYYTETLFTTGYNEITANATTIAAGDKVTVMVKFQNDGETTLSDVTAYAEIPENLTVSQTTGATADQKVETTVAELAPEETGSLTFTLDTSAYTDATIVIPAYVKVGDEEYPIGAVAIEVVNATLSAPQVVKENTPFKVSGEAIAESTVEILDYATKTVLAATHTNSRWFFADVEGLEADTVLIAKVTKDGKVGYSEPVTVKVEENPIAVNNIKIKHNGAEYTSNSCFGYPTFSTSVGGDLRGGNIGVEVKFDNMPSDAEVTYSFANRKATAQLEEEYYKGTIKNWRASGIKKVVATVKAGEEEYEFIVAEVIILIDPSGYITNAETGKPIEGATVLIEEKVGDEWVAWDAQPHKQQNPMLTDENGHYGWDVPEGTYRIIVSKEGFETKIVETYDSKDHGENSPITVLPVRTDVDIAIGYALPIELKAEVVSVAGGKVKFEFTRPVNGSITADNFKVLDAEGNEVEGTLVVSEDNTVVLFKPAQAMAQGSYKLSLVDIKDNDQNTITEETGFTKTADEAALAAPTVAYADGVITITFAQKPVNAKEEISVMKNGTPVSGEFSQDGNVVTFTPDAALADGSYTVEISDAVRTETNNYLAAAVAQNITVGTSVTPSAPAGGGGGGVGVYTVKFETNGGNSVSSVKVNKNGTMKSVPTPTRDGYKFVGWYTDKELTVAFDASAKITKAMTLYAKWEAQEKTEQPSSGLFADVTQSAWYYEAVKYVKENGLFGGVSETEFAPNLALTRAMLVTVLYRAEGEPEVDTASNFTDVADGQYYAKAVAWAQSNNIVNGVSETEFAPDANITREQMAAIIYRYAGFKGAAEQTVSELDYSDLSDISDWAEAAVAFCKAKNIMTGKGNNEFKPLDNATRAEAAAILQRYFTNK